MMQFLIAAPRSGSGKTTVTCAVLTALQRRGTEPSNAGRTTSTLCFTAARLGLKATI